MSLLKGLGELASGAIRILNVPARVVEKLVDPESEIDDEENILSKPLETIAKVLEEATDDKKRD